MRRQLLRRIRSPSTLHEWQTTNRQMPLRSELERLGQNAVNVSCAPLRSSLSDENCVHFDDLRNLMKMQDYNVSTEILTSDTASWVAAEETSHDRIDLLLQTRS